MPAAHCRSLLTPPTPFTPAAADAWFAAIATRLLDGCRLRAGASSYRFTEVEAYYHGPGHPDPFTHRDPLQTECGRWYFHRTAGVYRSGSFKGVDLTFGEANAAGTTPTASTATPAFGGMLIRGIERDDGHLIDGPSLTVDHLLVATGHSSMGELDRAIAGRAIWDADSPLQLDWTDLTGRKLYRSGRVGITLRRARSEAATRFVMKPYRFLTEPRRITKGKPLIVVGLYENGSDAAAIVQTTGAPRKAVDRYLAAYEAGKADADFSQYVGKEPTPADLCRLSGTWRTVWGG